MKKTLLCITLALSSFLAQAATTQADTKVSAALNNACIIKTDDVNLGTYNPNSTHTTEALLKVSFFCSPDVAYIAGLSTGSSLSFTKRTMKNSNGENLKYNIYVWYEENGESVILADNNNDNNITFNNTSPSTSAAWQDFYFKSVIDKNQYVSPGVYSDSITATISY